MPSVLWRCWLGIRKGIWPVKIWLMRCWRGYLLERSANGLHMVQLIPLPAHHVCFRKIQNGLSFWYRLTWVVTAKGRETVVLVVVDMTVLWTIMLLEGVIFCTVLFITAGQHSSSFRQLLCLLFCKWGDYQKWLEAVAEFDSHSVNV